NEAPASQGRAGHLPLPVRLARTAGKALRPKVPYPVDGSKDPERQQYKKSERSESSIPGSVAPPPGWGDRAGKTLSSRIAVWSDPRLFHTPRTCPTRSPWPKSVSSERGLRT